MAEPALIHCSYHKCLTVYYSRVFGTLLNRGLRWSGGYRHFNSDLREFLGAYRGLRLASLNNRALDLEVLAAAGDFRVSRFVRDPRDLIVSGYFYHRRGAEPWTLIDGPTTEDWYFANGVVPAGLRARGGSFASYLQELPLEEGLLAEMEFRGNHLRSMAQWPEQHPKVITFRYEQIVGNERGVFEQLFDFYGFGWLERGLGRWLAKRHSLQQSTRRRASRDLHVRNPASGQWREHFTPAVTQAFQERHGDVVARLGYPAD